MNVGSNSTYNYQEAGSIEAHLLDLDRDIYEEPVISRSLSHIWEEQKFPDARTLGEQLKEELATAHLYFGKGKEPALCD